MDFVVIPRRRSYWIEAIREGGEHQVIACCASEGEALERLRDLREGQQAREHRRMAVEVSRFNTRTALAPSEP
jgi:hypothetical protein